MEGLKILQYFIHYGLHFLAPGLISYILFRSQWRKAWLIFIATMLVDLDHLAATPIFDPTRCSVGYHLLHSYPAIAIYGVVFLIIKQQVIRIISLGLLFHMLTDFIDCMMTAAWT